MIMGDFLNTVVAALVVALAVFLAQRTLPTKRWSQQLALDASTLSTLPDGPEKAQFELHVRRQVARLVIYRTRMIGANWWIAVSTWTIVIVGTATIVWIFTFTLKGTSIAGIGAAIAGTGVPVVLVLLSGVVYAVFHGLGGFLVPRLDKIEVPQELQCQDSATALSA